jgi:hypothetical protein
VACCHELEAEWVPSKVEEVRRLNKDSCHSGIGGSRQWGQAAGGQSKGPVLVGCKAASTAPPVITSTAGSCVVQVCCLIPVRV